MLPDVLDINPKVIFCGTAAGSTSARRQQYYAGPGNKFWSIFSNLNSVNSRFS